MLPSLIVIAAIIALWIAHGAWLAHQQKITLRQGLLLSPLKLFWRVGTKSVRDLGRDKGPIIYMVSHQSRLDPALMLALLPDDTLHILDEYSARAYWLEPWRELSRTIAFNPEHVFVSRRLVRVLRRGGRLCVYMPADADPGSKMFRLYRAVARIAMRAEARVMPIHVAGAKALPFSLIKDDGVPRRLFQKLAVRALEPTTIEELVSRAQPETNTSSGALFGRMEEARGDKEGENLDRRAA
jgi:acyl-[acyl-carrier-protein]-phospholipid O-acyltransferase/long-chain-fatty-acid--[acyl-carrier-protein] ligase